MVTLNLNVLKYSYNIKKEVEDEQEQLDVEFYEMINELNENNMSLDDLRNYIQMEINTKNESIKLNNNSNVVSTKNIHNSEKKKLLKS